MNWFELAVAISLMVDGWPDRPQIRCGVGGHASIHVEVLASGIQIHTGDVEHARVGDLSDVAVFVHVDRPGACGLLARRVRVREDLS